MEEIAGRWLRVSTGAQDEASQLPDVDRYITAHGYADGPVYTLHDVSASKGEQDAYLAQVCADGRAGKLTVLVGWHVDRLDRRGPWATGDFVRQCADAGVRVETTSEGVISDRNLDGLVKQWMAREESDHKAERVRIAHAGRKARGALVGKVAWGYESICTVDGTPRCGNKQHDKVPQPSDTGRAFVKDVYARAIAGESLRSIAAWLTAETGKAISDTGVRNILTLPIYTGRHVYSDGAVLECEALVSADMQEQARKALAARLRRGQRSSSAVTPPALLIPGCLSCGGKAYRSLSGGRKREYVYYCRKCGRQISCERLETSIFSYAMQTGHSQREMRQVWVEGSDSASERAAIKRAMRELDPEQDDYLDKASALRDALKALPEATPGHFAERPTGRSMADAIMAIEDDRTALRNLYRSWAIAFAMDEDGQHFTVSVNGATYRRKTHIRTAEERGQVAA